MNKTTSHQNTVYPQTVEIPEPLEVHPFVDPELARGLIAAVEYIDRHPDLYEQGQGYNLGPGKSGCVICHVENLSNWRRPRSFPEDNSTRLPVGHWGRIWGHDCWPALGFNRATVIPRIEHFLRTGQ